MTEPITISAKEFARFISENDAVPAAFESKRETNEQGELITTDYRVDGHTGASEIRNNDDEEMYLH